MEAARLPPVTPATMRAAIIASRAAGELASQPIVIALAEHRNAILRRRRAVEASTPR